MRLFLIISFLFFQQFSQAKDFLFAGDTMIGEHEVTRTIFGESLPILKENYDFIFFNFEGTVGNRLLDKLVPKCNSGSFCYTFMVNYKNLDLFNSLNNRIVFNLANNHSMDFGKLIQTNTRTILKKNFYPIGTEENPEFVFQDDKVVFIGASPHKGTFSINNPQIFKKVKYFKSLHYIVIISLHMGKEGINESIVNNRDEVFLGQNRGNIYRLSRLLIDNGADIIVGHGPHISRGFELYKNKLIFYSLGNFLTYGSFSLNNQLSYSTLMKVTTNESGDFIQGKIEGFQQTKQNNPVLWNKKVALIKKQNEVVQWYQHLNNVNGFNSLIIKNDGSFYKKEN